MRLAVLFTGGKDSTYASYLAQKEGHQLVCLITVRSENQYSYMFHTPAIELTELQAEVIGLPLITDFTKGDKEDELMDLERVIKKAQQQFQFEGIITGALFSEYQSSRIQKICDKLKLKCVNPLWQKSQEQEMQELLDNNFKIIFTAVAADGLNKFWLNKIITEQELEQLKKLNRSYGFHLAGEGGEFESLVLDCPLFKKQVVIEEFEIIEESEHNARLIIKKARLEEK